MFTVKPATKIIAKRTHLRLVAHQSLCGSIDLYRPLELEINSGMLRVSFVQDGKPSIRRYQRFLETHVISRFHNRKSSAHTGTQKTGHRGLLLHIIRSRCGRHFGCVLSLIRKKFCMRKDGRRNGEGEGSGREKKSGEKKRKKIGLAILINTIQQAAKQSHERRKDEELLGLLSEHTALIPIRESYHVI